MATILLVDNVDGIRRNVSRDEAIRALVRSRDSEDYILWLDFQGFTDDDVKTIHAVAPLHDITREELFNGRVREKWSDYQDYLYVIGHGLNFNAGRALLDTISVHFVVFPRSVLSFHAEQLRSVEVVVERLTNEFNQRLPSEDWVLYGFLNALSNLYMDFVDHCVEVVEAIDAAVLREDESTRDGLLERISEARRDLLKLRRKLVPKRDFLQVLCGRDHVLISHSTQVLLRNVMDHVIRMEELAEMARETLTGAQSNYIAQVSNRMNAVMKTLSIVATIMLPLTLVAGLFGMNVHVPGQETQDDALFWALIASMALVALGLVWLFRKMKWL